MFHHALAAVSLQSHASGWWDAVQVASDMGDLVAEGINSFKFFLAYKVSCLHFAFHPIIS